MKIQLFEPTFRVEECLMEMKVCLEKGWTGIGFKTLEFEDNWKKYTGLKNAHFVNSATAALHLAVKILKLQNNWQDGEEIISTPLTFVSTNHAIMYENMKVIFADVDEYLCLDPTDVEKKITDKTRAVMYVGLAGNSGRYEELVRLCNKYHLKLIVDAAHMAGTKFKGEILGKEADAIVYSFQAVKNLPTGDSGMICFKEKEDDIIGRKMSWLGINKDTYARDQGSYKWQYEVDYVGYKYNGNSIMAAIGLVQLKYLEQDNAYRNKLAERYDTLFEPYKDKIRPIPIFPDCESSRHLYIIEVNNRDELLQELNKEEIYPGVHYRDNTEYEMYNYAKGSCPKAHHLSQRIISLPLHLKITNKEIDYIAQCVIKYAK